jgi:hypothetical protein
MSEIKRMTVEELELAIQTVLHDLASERASAELEAESSRHLAALKEPHAGR